MKFELKKGLIWAPIELIYEGTRMKIANCIIDTGNRSYWL